MRGAVLGATEHQRAGIALSGGLLAVIVGLLVRRALG
jgi:hypothetical protein